MHARALFSERDHFSNGRPHAKVTPDIAISYPPDSKSPIPRLNARCLIIYLTIDICWKLGILGGCVGPSV